MKGSSLHISPLILSPLITRKCMARRIEAFNSGFDKAEDPLVSTQKMKAIAIKKELDKLGIDCSDCFEKDELARRLARALASSNDIIGTPKGALQEKALVCLPMNILRSTVSTLASTKEDILLPLMLDGKGPFNFVVDTGCSTTLLKTETAWDKLQLKYEVGKQTFGLGAGGSPLSGTQTVKLSNVSIGNQTCRPVDAIVMDLSGRLDGSVAGIVGMNILCQFDIEFDFITKNIYLYAAGLAHQHDCLKGMQQLVTCPGTFGIPYILVQVGSTAPLPAILDLGCSLCVASLKVAADAGISSRALDTRPALGGYGLAGESMLFRNANIDIKIPMMKRGESSEALIFENVNFAIGDIPAMKIMGSNVILGISLFQQSKLMISMSTGTIFLQRSMG